MNAAVTDKEAAGGLTLQTTTMEVVNALRDTGIRLQNWDAHGVGVGDILISDFRTVKTCNVVFIGCNARNIGSLCLAVSGIKNDIEIVSR